MIKTIPGHAGKPNMAVDLRSQFNRIRDTCEFYRRQLPLIPANLQSVANPAAVRKLALHCHLFIYHQVNIMWKSLVYPAILLSLLTGCDIQIDGKNITVAGKQITEQRTIKRFDTIENSSFFDIVVSQDNEPPANDRRQLSISGDQQLVAQLETVVQDGRLLIRNRQSGLQMSWPDRSGTIVVTTSGLRAAYQSGSGNMEIRALKSAELTIQLSGPGDLTLAGQTDKLAVQMSGSGDLDARQLQARQIDIDLSGPGDLLLAGGASGDSSIRSSGSGDIRISDLHLTRLSLTQSGPGSISLHGQIDSWVAALSGSGDLQLDDLQSQRAELQVDGPGDVRLSGKVGQLSARLNGSGDLDAGHLQIGQLDLVSRGPGSTSLAEVQQQLHADLSGSGDLSASLTGTLDIDLQMSGPGDVSLSGQARALRASIQGSGGLSADKLLLDSASIKVSGSSEAVVNVRQAGVAKVVKINRNGLI